MKVLAPRNTRNPAQKTIYYEVNGAPRRDGRPRAVPNKAASITRSDDKSSHESVGYTDSTNITIRSSVGPLKDDCQAQDYATLPRSPNDVEAVKELLVSFPTFKGARLCDLDGVPVGSLEDAASGSLLMRPGCDPDAMLVLQGTVRVFVCPQWLQESSNLFDALPKASLDEIIAHLVEFDIYSKQQLPMDLALNPNLTDYVEPCITPFVHVADFKGPLLLNVAFQLADCLGIKKSPQIVVRCVDKVTLQRLTLQGDVEQIVLRDDVRRRMMSIHTRFLPPLSVDQWKQALGLSNELRSVANCAAAPLVLRKGDVVSFNYTAERHLPVETSVYLVLDGSLEKFGEADAPYIWPPPCVALFACVGARAVVASPHLICWKISRADYLALLFREAPALQQYITEAAGRFVAVYGKRPRFSAHDTEASIIPTFLAPFTRFSQSNEHRTGLTVDQLQTLGEAMSSEHPETRAQQVRKY